MNAEKRTFQTLTQMMAHRAENATDETWLHFQGKAYTYGDIWRTSALYRDELHRRDVLPGEYVLILMDNSPAFFNAFFGIARAGAVPVPLSPKSNSERLTYIVGDCRASLIITDKRFLTSRFAAENLTDELRPLLAEAECIEATDPINSEDRPANELAFIQYTSGSTGNAKGTMISHDAVLANIEAFTARFDLDPNVDVMSSMMPLFHDMGLICFGLGSIHSKTPLALYLQEAISLYHWLDSFATFKVTISGGPNIFLHLANKVVRDASKYDLSTCKMMICGSEPIFPEVVRTFEKKYNCPGIVKPAYGMAELSLCATITAHNEVPEVLKERYISCGTPLDNVELFILDDQGKFTLEPHISGEVVLRSPSQMSGYLNRPNLDDSFINGFYKSGDEGFLDGQGRLYILGRRKNLIIRGGEKFSPADLESLASNRPEVVMAAVVGQSEDKMNSDLIVLVAEVTKRLLDDPVSLEKLSAEICRESNKRFRYQPDRILFTAKGSIPFTTNGKLQHQVLRRRLEADNFPFNLEIVANTISTSA